MNIDRKIDLSIYYWLTDLLGSKATVVDGFPSNELGVPAGELTLPTVASERMGIVRSPLELGSTDTFDRYGYYIYIFAKTKAQRDDLAYLISDRLNDGINVYNYDLGFPPTTVTQSGALIVDSEIAIDNTYGFPEANQNLYWRSVIDFRGYYTP